MSDRAVPRRQRKKDRTRRSIFEAAFALFRARGFEAVTVAEICRDADVARGTFFQHYSSKTALLRDWDERLAAELGDRLSERRRGALAEYRTLVEWLGERWTAQPDLLGALLAELLRAGAGPGSPLLLALEGVARRAQRRGELRANLSPRLAAWLLLSGSAAVAAGALCAPGDEPRARGELLQALLSGLREPKPRVAWRPPSAPAS